MSGQRHSPDPDRRILRDLGGKFGREPAELYERLARAARRRRRSDAKRGKAKKVG